MQNIKQRGLSIDGMLAVIQAGGKGTRIRDLTNDEIPKPLLRLNNKTLLQWQIETIKRYGIKEFAIIIGHQGDKIRKTFGDGSDYGISINYIEEHTPMGSAGSLYFLKDYSFSDVLLVFCDIMFDMDLNRLIKFHKKNNSLLTLVAHPNSHPYDSDIIQVDNDGRVLNILGKNETRTEWFGNLVNAGIFIFDKRIIDKIETPRKLDLEKDIIDNLLRTRRVFAYKTSEYIKDVGTPERFETASFEQKNGIWKQKNLEKKQRCIFLDRDGTLNKFVGYISDSNQLELEDEAAEAIKMINESGFLAILITNQPVVARGLCTENDVRIIHNKLETLLGESRAYLDDISFCPHHPDKGFEGENIQYKVMCKCRKPQIGMILRMQEKYNIDLNESWYVGDTTTDVMTGINAGMHTVLLRTGEGGKDNKFDVKPDLKAENIKIAVVEILKRSKMN